VCHATYETAPKRNHLQPGKNFIPRLKPVIANNVVGMAKEKPRGDAKMPAFVIPVLIGIPVIVGGGYLILHVVK